MPAITQESLTWPFKDAEWQNKFLIGSLLVLAATLVPVVGLLGYVAVYGYALVVMRAAMRGEAPSLPKWENFGELFVDGLKAVLSAIGYWVPAIVLFFCAFGTLFVGFIGSIFVPALATAGSDRAAGGFVLLLFLSEFVFFVFFFIAFAVVVICQIPTPVAVGQYARTGEISAGYRFREVWAILRANAGGFILAWAVYLGIGVVLNYLLFILYATLIVCLFVQFILAPVTFYLTLMWAHLFGMAYREGAAKAGLAATVSGASV